MLLRDWKKQEILCNTDLGLNLAFFHTLLTFANQPISECLPFKNGTIGDFPGGPVVKNPPSNSGHTSLISGRVGN